jgi:hypothetical protein
MTGFAQQIIDRNHVVIQLIRSVNTDNVPFYAYIMLKADRWALLQQRLNHENIDFSKEAKILAFGEGHEPDMETQAAIEKIRQQLASIEGK